MSEMMTTRKCVYCQRLCTDDGEDIPNGVSIDIPDEQIEWGLCNECIVLHPLSRRKLNAIDRIAAARRVVARRTYEVVEGVLLDALTATAIVKVYDACNEMQRNILFNRHISEIGEFALKVVK